MTKRNLFDDKAKYSYFIQCTSDNENQDPASRDNRITQHGASI